MTRSKVSESDSTLTLSTNQDQHSGVHYITLWEQVDAATDMLQREINNVMENADNAVIEIFNLPFHSQLDLIKLMFIPRTFSL